MFWWSDTTFKLIINQTNKSVIVEQQQNPSYEIRLLIDQTLREKEIKTANYYCSHRCIASSLL